VGVGVGEGVGVGGMLCMCGGEMDCACKN
jgi:hypothetical protein